MQRGPVYPVEHCGAGDEVAGAVVTGAAVTGAAVTGAVVVGAAVGVGVGCTGFVSQFKPVNPVEQVQMFGLVHLPFPEQANGLLAASELQVGSQADLFVVAMYPNGHTMDSQAVPS